MNPVLISIGPLEIRTFSAWIGLGVGIGGIVVLAIAARAGQRLMPWLDTLIGGLIGGLIGARAFHVWLNWAYFGSRAEEILDLRGGGLDWHGAVVGGVLAAALVARWRHVPIKALYDALALAFPILAIAVWQGCAQTACGYGIEVRSLADHPAWLVTESPDVLGDVAPRLNLPAAGTAIAVAVLLLVALWSALRLLRGLRLWLALIIYALAMAVLGFFRAEYVPVWFERRADQVLDLALAFLAAMAFAGTALARRAETSVQQGVDTAP
jgi:phosphatidylglycerol:prolipoprotein diacylglycerol transferase